MTAVIGIDPGLSGAISVYDAADGALVVKAMPTLEKPISGKKNTRTIIDEHSVLELIRFLADTYGAKTAYIEQVGGRQGQSASAAFNFGHGYGCVRLACIAAGLAIEPITPQVWKLAMRAPRDKGLARARASELLPRHAHNWKLVKDDGKAESALIALYGSRRA